MTKQSIYMLPNTLAIDPSWNGFGFAYYSDLEKEGFADCYCIIIKKTKNSQTVLKTIEYIRGAIDRMLKEYPEVKNVEHIVIESQFHTKMQNLQYITATYFHSMFYPVNIYFTSALTVKRHYAIQYKGFTHYQNKKNALEYVDKNKDWLICGELHHGNDNICDAILLLNYHFNKTEPV